MTAFVQFDEVSMHYGTGTSTVRALERVNLGFARGDFICIVGPSGCGKTTMMQTLAGFLRPTLGTVSVDGQTVTGPGADRGVVFQQPALFPWLTVAANAGFGPRMTNASGAPARVEQWLRTTGLWEFRDRYPYELSGGMQQRLAIARALCNEPKVLLMDEPFGALDALTRERMQEEAVYLGTEVVVMSPRPGRIVAKLPTTFAREHAAEGIRSVKSRPDFVAAREEVLSLIWSMGDEH